MIIHGTKDRIVPFSHAKALYKMSNKLFIPLWVKLAGHNNLFKFQIVHNTIKKFVTYLETQLMKEARR